MKRIDPRNIKKILFISLSNIGDAILTTPSLHLTRLFFKNAAITVMVGPRAREIFENHPYLTKTIIYNKHASLREKLTLMMQLKKEKFDLVIDLKNTAIPIFIRPRFSTPILKKKVEGHAVFRHLSRLKILGIEGPATFTLPPLESCGVEVEQILLKKGMRNGSSYIVLGPGAANRLKRWEVSKFAQLAKQLKEKYSLPIVVVGPKEDREEFEKVFSSEIIQLTGELSLMQVAALLKKAKLFIANDSGPMHLAVAVNCPVLAIFGPTDPKIYSPYGCLHQVVRLEIPCSPCMEGFCRIKTHECMKDLDVGQVFRTACEMLLKQ